MIIASLYSKPVNKSIAFHYGQKNNGYSAFIPNTRYLVYQPRLTDAIIVIFGLLSYEHPCKHADSFFSIISINFSGISSPMDAPRAVHPARRRYLGPRRARSCR